jgi:hypothetical protein
MPERISSDLSQAIFDTLLYSDIFEFPLQAYEIHRYLFGRVATYENVCEVLASDPRFIKEGEYFVLPGREKNVRLREQREQRSQKLLPYALAYGRIIASLPFIRMVALTGSLAVHNISMVEDFDYMLVTQPGRLWTARAFVLLFGRFTRLNGHTICPNVIVAEDSLEWSQQDLYSARDLCQMIPIAGKNVYQSLMKANGWVMDFLPNAYGEAVPVPMEKKRKPILKRLVEFLLGGRLGAHFERWEMNRKIERFSRQEGFGEETIFNASICQGNFDQHRKWTRQELGKRGASLNRKDSIRENGL